MAMPMRGTTVDDQVARALGLPSPSFAPERDSISEALSLPRSETLQRDSLARAVGSEAGRLVHYGRRVTIQNGASNPASVLRTEMFPDARVWTVEVQYVPTTTSFSFTNAPRLVVTYGLGNAQFTRTVLCPVPGPIAGNTQAPPWRFLVVGNYVQIDAYQQNGAGSVDVNIGVAEGDYTSTSMLMPLFLRLAPGASIGQLYGSQAACPNVSILQMHVIYQTLVGAAGTPFWPMVFDLAAQPILNQAPILTLGAVYAVGDDRSYGDEFKPGSLVTYTTSIWVGLSSTPDLYTPTATGSIVVEAKLGS